MKITEENFVAQMKKRNEEALEYVIDHYVWIYFIFLIFVKSVFKYQNLDGDLSGEITAITLTPYAAKLPEKSGKLSDDWEQVGEAFTIFLNQ